MADDVIGVGRLFFYSPDISMFLFSLSIIVRESCSVRVRITIRDSHVTSILPYTRGDLYTVDNDVERRLLCTGNKGNATSQWETSTDASIIIPWAQASNSSFTTREKLYNPKSLCDEMTSSAAASPTPTSNCTTCIEN